MVVELNSNAAKIAELLVGPLWGNTSTSLMYAIWIQIDNSLHYQSTHQMD